MSDAAITIFGITLEPSLSFSLFGRLELYWYGVLVAVGFLAAVFFAAKTGKRFGISDDHVTDALIFAVPAAVVGARLFYVLGNLSLYQGNFAAVFRVWEGGLSLWGGLVLALPTVWLVCRKKKISFLALLDTAAPALLLGIAIGIWGNFINRQGYGVDTTLPWKMGLTRSGVTAWVHPLFLYEFLWNVLGFVLLCIWTKKHQRAYDGQLFAMFVVWYGFIRVVLGPLQSDYGTAFVFGRFAAAVVLCVAVVVLLHNKLHAPKTREALFVDGGPAFHSLKRGKKGRYGEYFDDEINDAADPLAVGASYPGLPSEETAPGAAADEAQADAEEDEVEEDQADGEPEDDGFEPFGDGAGKRDQ